MHLNILYPSPFHYYCFLLGQSHYLLSCVSLYVFFFCDVSLMHLQALLFLSWAITLLALLCILVYLFVMGTHPMAVHELLFLGGAIPLLALLCNHVSRFLL